jgi:hypothetical protein
VEIQHIQNKCGFVSTRVVGLGGTCL